MGLKKELTPEQRSQIVQLRKAGYSYKRISGKIFYDFKFLYMEIFIVAKSTVINTFKKYHMSENFESESRSGRPSKLNGRDMRHLIQKIKDNPAITSEELSRDATQMKKECISSSCIRQRLLRIGLRSFAARKSSYLTEAGKRKRLAWCKKYKNKTLEFWRNVLFTDETTIDLNPTLAINRVRRFSFENPYQKRYTCQKIKHPLKVMFWGGICGETMTEIVACDGMMNSDNYINNILEKHVTPLLQNCPDLKFQQDNAPCHTSKKVNEYFLRHNLQKIDWPPNSPDLNIIENVWRIVKMHINRMPIKSKNQLIQATKLIWSKKITKELIENLILSINNRIAKCLENKGGPSGY